MNSKPCVVYIFLALFFCCNYSSHSQSSLSIPFTRKLGPSNGLSSYNASKIVQDSYGFIWIATQDGLNRYDGKKFVIYSKSSQPKHRLLGSVINDMILDTSRNLLWVTSSYGGLNGINIITGNVEHSLKGIVSKNGLPNDWLKCFNISEGKIWIGTSEGLAVYDPLRSEFIQTEALPWPAIKAGFNINFVYADKYGHVWLFLPNYGIAVYSGTNYKLIKHYSNEILGVNEYMAYLQFNSRIAAYKTNSFIWATDHGFKCIVYNDKAEITSLNKDFALNKSFGNKMIYTCALDKNEKLWFSTMGQLFAGDIQSGSFQPVKDISGHSEMNWIDNTYGIFFDRENNVWLGTQKGVVYAKNESSQFQPYFENNDQRILHAYHLYSDDDKTVFIAAQNGFFQVDTESGMIKTLDNTSSYNFIFKISGHLITSRLDGIFVYASGKLKAISSLFPELKQLDTEVLNSAQKINDSIYVFSSEKSQGLYVWNSVRKKLNFILPADQIRNTIINTIFINAAKEIIVVFDNSIGRFDPVSFSLNRFQINDPDLQIPLSIFLDICEFKGHYWLAVYGKGIIQTDRQFRIKKIYSLPEGLTNTGIYKLLPYRDSILFATTNNGLFTLNLSTNKIHQYLKEDGLNTSNFEERTAFAGNQYFFAGGVEGFTKINPALFNSNDKLPVTYINEFEIKLNDGFTDSFNLELQKIVIPSNALQSTIHFSAINFSNPEQLKYAYRIEELHDDWIQLGSQHFVDIIGIPPGNYTLLIRTANENGLWGHATKVIIDIQPKWYQTWWFKMSIAFILIAVLYAAYRYRIKQLAIQQKIREEIASDLHDDIGSTLNSAKVFTHLAQKERSKEEYLKYAEDSLTEATSGLRDMIWVLDNTKDTIGELVERINKFSVPLADASQINFRCLVQNEMNNYAISKNERKNLFLIVKEAVNNSIKYAECQNIKIEITSEKKSLKILINDDGKGFETTRAHEGNGVKNIYQRAVQMNYTAKISSQPGIGTSILIMKD